MKPSSPSIIHQKLSDIAHLFSESPSHSLLSQLGREAHLPDVPIHIKKWKTGFFTRGEARSQISEHIAFFLAKVVSESSSSMGRYSAAEDSWRGCFFFYLPSESMTASHVQQRKRCLPSTCWSWSHKKWENLKKKLFYCRRKRLERAAVEPATAPERVPSKRQFSPEASLSIIS